MVNAEPQNREFTLECPRALGPGRREIKKDSPEPPRLSSKPSRLEGQLDETRVLTGCCTGIAE